MKISKGGWSKEADAKFMEYYRCTKPKEAKVLYEEYLDIIRKNRIDPTDWQHLAVELATQVVKAEKTRLISDGGKALEMAKNVLEVKKKHDKL